MDDDDRISKAAIGNISNIIINLESMITDYNDRLSKEEAKIHSQESKYLDQLKGTNIDEFPELNPFIIDDEIPVHLGKIVCRNLPYSSPSGAAAMPMVDVLPTNSSDIPEDVLTHTLLSTEKTPWLSCASISDLPHRDKDSHVHIIPSKTYQSVSSQTEFDYDRKITTLKEMIAQSIRVAKYYEKEASTLRSEVENLRSQVEEAWRRDEKDRISEELQIQVTGLNWEETPVPQPKLLETPKGIDTNETVTNSKLEKHAKENNLVESECNIHISSTSLLENVKVAVMENKEYPVISFGSHPPSKKLLSTSLSPSEYQGPLVNRSVTLIDFGTYRR